MNSNDQYGKSGSAKWIDEQCGMSIKHPSMHTVIGPVVSIPGTIYHISTPSLPSMNLQDYIEMLAWENELVKKTKLGKLLYA